MNAELRILWVATLLALPSGISLAGPIGVPNNFQAGSTAKASEVNANFTAVVNGVNTNDTRLTTIETTVTGGDVVLVPSTATAGRILKGTFPFIHDFGVDNTFIGVSSGNFSMTGQRNTASGSLALQSNTTGDANTASGAQALQFNTTGIGNTANGASALHHNTTGLDNTASGVSALQNNTTGSNNTASGFTALLSNTTGFLNVASGDSALQNNTIGAQNTASGARALINNTTGSNNTASGKDALLNNSTGNGNIAIGSGAGINQTNGSFNIYIGSGGVASESSTIRIGGAQTAAFIAGIRGITTGSATGVAVLIDANGQLGTVSSSRRVKDDITDMGSASSTLLKLRPVTFHYKNDRSTKGRTLQYGLVAEEVAQVAPGLVARSADGKVETVYYQFLAPMLLNEYQKQQRTIEAQAVRIAELESRSAELAELRQQVARMAKQLARIEHAGTIAAAGR